MPGAGTAPQHTWVDIFHRIQAAGKSVEVWGNIEAIKWLHPQLKPDLVWYLVSGISSPTEADDLLEWLAEHS